MGMLTAAAFVSIYPVAYAMLHAYWLPRPWYRVPFVIHTLMLVWGGLSGHGVPIAKTAACRLLITLTVVLPGTHWTRQLWNERMLRAEREGKFYIENPDKLLLSEEEAFWFIAWGSTRCTGWRGSTISTFQPCGYALRRPGRPPISHDLAICQRAFCRGNYSFHRSIAQDTPLP